MSNIKQPIRILEPGVVLYRDPENGIAWIESGKTGLGTSVHPNIDVTGSVEGMIDRGFWNKKDRIRRSHGWIYNIDRFVCWPDDELEKLVAEECMCEACIERRNKKKN